MKLQDVLLKQDEFLNGASYRKTSERIEYLKILKKEIKNSKEDILNALNKDIGKSNYEGFLTEYQVVIEELNFYIKNLYSLMKVENVGTSINIFPGRGKIIKKPYGKILIQSPWNYPFQLALVPTIGAVAAGNTIVLKTSSKVVNTNKIIDKILKALPAEIIYFANEYSHEEVLNEKYDFYFFTGSKKIGNVIYQKATENFAPAVLELGGKSPCIIDETSNLKDTAKKLAWGKFLNSGQTCVAPDYVFAHKNIKDKLIELLKKEIENKYSDENNLAKIITTEKVEKLAELIKDRKDIYGGECEVKDRVFKPTLLTNANIKDEIMQYEIFGPILPIIAYEELDEVINYVRSKDNPLALYMFSASDKNIHKVINSVNFGGGCINDVIVHVSENKLPFGGFGSSGVGKYHGKYSIDTFTHEMAIVETYSKFSNNFRYPPYTKGKFNIIKKLLG